MKPFCMLTPRRVPLPLLKKTGEVIKCMISLDVIEPIDELIEWRVPIVVVPKPSGDV